MNSRRRYIAYWIGFVPTKIEVPPAVFSPVEIDGGIACCKSGGATRSPIEASADARALTKSRSCPLTWTPTANPPMDIREAVLSPTTSCPAWSDATICLANTADSRSREYETTFTLRPAKRLTASVKTLWLAGLSRRGAICASNFRRSIRSCSAALFAVAAFSFAFAASAPANSALSLDFATESLSSSACFVSSALRVLCVSRSRLSVSSLIFPDTTMAYVAATPTSSAATRSQLAQKYMLSADIPIPFLWLFLPVCAVVITGFAVMVFLAPWKRRKGR